MLRIKIKTKPSRIRTQTIITAHCITIYLVVCYLMAIITVFFARLPYCLTHYNCQILMYERNSKTYGGVMNTASNYKRMSLMYTYTHTHTFVSITLKGATIRF